MTRTQISLTEEQHRFLGELSRQSGESVSAIIRKAIERLRAEHDSPTARALKLLGKFKSDRPDVSVNHDEILWGTPLGKKENFS